ncbi:MULTISPECIES: hypothetical protein [Kordiimonas]|uniref:hypothetical protein n=1 Tax=Kordiimonas TaxID=288021 RepID=UPI001FF645C5|nr:MULTISPECIES: hypothetical protein [Kordiimonas]MCK0068672.1 hypothetical protein [Kordiimonas laminariae]UTW58027.1 hypothetical protein KFE96_14545 [Kordiimonas sp. SCSIO 12603]
MKKLLAIAALFSLSACSLFEGKGEEIIFDTTLGPKTEDQIKTLPSNLQGDAGNANYLGTERKGPQLESEDGSK